ncbi:TetR/AcrR family transcriptional regulator [Luteimonas aquatica]|uniref:TetR/AcrR family transcriptional regulator n=1 Tax=Luteimonas aquatica TaxID=450364 RepID=UPI001F5AF3D6|nr:TetR/AcrR family transcriptional regulator [Luteimonas aquatica]
MSARPTRQPASAGASKPASPGRPKDLAKGAAILEAAKRMFLLHGYERMSMDQIAAEAGVSKLTVYSHYGDKQTLFLEAVKAHCEQQLPEALFEPSPATPLRERLLDIAAAFHAMISSPEAVAGHRLMCTPQIADSPLPNLFWEAGPRRIQNGFAALLQRRIEAGELEIDDVPRAAVQFFSLLKGEFHDRLVMGCALETTGSVDEHLKASIEMFLRAYGQRPGAARTRAS